MKLVFDSVSQTRCLESLFDSTCDERLEPNCRSIPVMFDNAINACPVSYTFDMLQNVYLSGGLSMIPGIPERLKEIFNYNYGRTDEPEWFQFLVIIEDVTLIHAHNYRQHVAYLGACEIALTESFDKESIRRKDFENEESKEYDHRMVDSLLMDKIPSVKYQEHLRKNAGKFPHSIYKNLLDHLFVEMMEHEQTDAELQLNRKIFDELMSQFSRYY